LGSVTEVVQDSLRHPDRSLNPSPEVGHGHAHLVACQSPPRSASARTVFMCPIRRFPPTGMGITEPIAPPAAAASVHPHWRGDHGSGPNTSTTFPGSPPRAWGSRQDCDSYWARLRFTPTGVRITSWPARSRRRPTVHPHGRGDHTVRNGFGCSSVGSPPRAWGSRVRNSLAVPRVRFTPTGVGITVASAFSDSSSNGSPPRAWGSHLRPFVDPLRRRFTPTGVGITRQPTCKTARNTVHPHGRGDHAFWMRSMTGRFGSPPRAWGSRRGVLACDAVERFTPTGVGITTSTAWWKPPQTVHPHGRGDHFVAS